MPEPDPPGATWVIRDPDGRVVDYSTEPIVLEVTTLIGDPADGSEEQ